MYNTDMSASFWIAQGLSVVGVIFNIIGVQLKKKTQIVLAYLFATIMFSIVFYLLEAYSGTINCIILSVMGVISYVLARKNKNIPIWISAIFIIAIVSIGIIFFTEFTDIFSIAASSFYALCLGTKREQTIRYLTGASLLCWMVYDVFSGAYFAAISDGAFTISTIVAIFRYSRPAKKHSKSGRKHAS